MMTVKEYALDVNKDVKVILEKCASLGFDKHKEDDLLTEEEVIDLDNAVYSEDDEEEKLIDKALIYIAPKIFGGLNAKTPISGEGIKEIEKAIKLIDGNIEKIDEDLFMEYYLKY